MSKQTIDTYGIGLNDFYSGKRDAKFKVYSDIAETEFWDISMFFRDFDDMPQVERLALEKVKGKTLDAGAGAGSHALLLQQRGFDVTAIDISEGAVEVMNKRGVKDARLADFFNFEGETYDTILMLMNGIGIVQKISNLDNFFSQIKKLLNAGGTLILDSSNIIYLFLDDDGSALIDLNADYYGEIQYRMDYGKLKGKPFDWVFIDFDTLQDAAERNGFYCEKIYEDDHYLYLAELKLR